MRAAFLSCLAILVGCSTGPHKPVREKPSGESQKALYKQTELEFEAGTGEEFDAILDECCKDPLVAQWVTRLMILHMKDAEQRQRERQHGRYHLRDLESNQRYTRARAALARMGLAAVPTIVEELVQHRFTDNRKFGVRILAAMPTAVLPALRAEFKKAQPKFRRHYVEAVAGMKPRPECELLLLEWSKHEDYSVRAAALTGLAAHGNQHGALLREALANDPDRFVQRQVVKALGSLRDRPTAAVIVGFYARCAQRGDRPGMREAERALVRISKSPPSRNGKLINYGLAHWKKWLRGLPPDWEGR